MKLIQILFVEDDHEMMDVYLENFPQPEFKTECAYNGDEALQILNQRGDEFDVVVTDNHMPRMDGVALLREIHKKFPKLRVIMITGYGNLTDYMEARDLGILKFLDKPVRMSQLKQLVRETVTGEQAE